MTAAAADRGTDSREAKLKTYPVKAATKIYKGTLVAIDTAAGYVTPAADSATRRVVGVADEQADNTSGASGDKKVRVRSGEAFRFTATSITQAMVGQVMYVVDDSTFDDTSGTNGVPCGRLVEFISTTEGWIFIPNGALMAPRIADGTYSANEQNALNDLVN